MTEAVTLSAATSVIRGLGRALAPSYDPPEFKLQSNGAKPTHVGSNNISLPGADGDAKRALEAELSALATRVQYLESKANVVNHHTFPDTPNEFGVPASPFSASNSSPIVKNGGAAHNHHGSSSSWSSVRHNRVSNLLTGTSRVFTAEELESTREFVEYQGEEIKKLKEKNSNIEQQLHETHEHVNQELNKVANEDINRLQRELLKHQQANEAFQKALKEIGTIITNVAHGDLSHKVQLHEKEMDPEITRFKNIINTMMDQLQQFGSEVSRVAREVGTEGILGGQAQITGVHGIWKELTENGIAGPFFTTPKKTNNSSQ